jgi:hypothetical protein
MILSPADIANRALDIIGVTTTIGDIEEGTVEARPFARNYVSSMQELLRAVRWNFARRQATLTLLQDATGQSAAPVGTGTVAMRPWVYEYAYPNDCMTARFVPLNFLPPSTSPPVPLTTANSLIPNYFVPTTPAPFLVSNDASSFMGGITNWNQLPDLNGAQGQGLISQAVILTNVPQATLVYTSRVTEPNVWDPAFQQALAAVLASRVAMAVIPDKKLAVAMQSLAINVAKTTISEARISNGNESLSGIDRIPDWISARGSGGYWNSGYCGPGYLWGLCDSVSFPDGTAF